MTGKAVIDFSHASVLPFGPYTLVDFASAGSGLPSVSGVAYPSLSNFSLVQAPGTDGSLQIQNNVLSYVVVPEPAIATLLGIASVFLLRRRYSRSRR